MDLGGLWRVAESTEEGRRRLADPDLDDSGWAEAPVPGHWRAVDGLEASDGPVLYRRRFSAEPPGEGERVFLVFDGLFYQGDVWLDNHYLGDTEGYFFPHSFEVTSALAAGPEHLLAVEVNCSRPSDLRAKRNLTGVFQHWDCIDPDWNPGGIWAGVRLVRTGPVRLAWLKMLCREASEERAVLDLEAEIDALAAGPVRLVTTVAAEAATGATEPDTRHEQEQTLSGGLNVVRWRVAVERPDLWWPRALGGQPLYRVAVEAFTAADGGDRPSDGEVRITGLRQVRVRDFIATVNGERLFLKGANLGPTRRDIGHARPSEVAADVALAAEANLDLLRVHAHIARPELYDAADRAGMLIWQDLPLQWGYANVRAQAAAQARQAARLLGHHPSIAVWCGHNEPVPVEDTSDIRPPARVAARLTAARLLPSYNRTALDRSIRRALERADPSREVVAHSGVRPHPAWGTDSHFYFGWYRGDERDLPAALARFPVLARFVGEFGAQAVPQTAGFMHPDRWPDLDWEELAAHHCLQVAVFEDRVPPADFASFEAWQEATQRYQASLLRHHIETLRRLKYRPTGGFCLFMLADAQPAVTWSVLDHERVPKAAFRTVAAACAPVIVTCERPPRSLRPGDSVSLDVHVVSDLRTPIADAEIRAEMRWPGGRRTWRFRGDVDADRCVRVGRLELSLPRRAVSGPIEVSLELKWPGGRADNHYESLLTTP